MIQTTFKNRVDIGDLFTKNYQNPWKELRYIKEEPLVIQDRLPNNEMMSPEMLSSSQNQSGGGISDYLSSWDQAKEILKQGTNLADEVIFGPIGTNISNTIGEYYNKNPEWKPGFSGEHHMILPTSNYGSKFTRANYAGPGTHLYKRLKRGDKGVDGPNGIDEAARIHDIDYANALSGKDVRIADDKFINRVRNSSQGTLTKKAVIGAMKAKKFAEDTGILSKEYFLKPEDNQKGFGRNKKSGKNVNNMRASKLKPKKVYAAEILQKYVNNQKKSKKKMYAKK